MAEEKKEEKKEELIPRPPGDFEAPRIWDYAKAKKLCAACGGETQGVGQTIPFCRRHEIEWLASVERGQAATARSRFVARLKKELEGDGKEGVK